MSDGEEVNVHFEAKEDVLVVKKVSPGTRCLVAQCFSAALGAASISSLREGSTTSLPIISPVNIQIQNVSTVIVGAGIGRLIECI